MSASIARVRQVFIVVTLLGMLLLGTAGVSAQATPIPISVGQNQAGSLVGAPETSVQYRLSIDTPQNVEIMVLGISAGVVPSYRLLDPSGVVVAEAVNSAGTTIVEGSATLSSPGSYWIEVSSTNETAGDFLISLQPGAPLLPPQPLVLGELQNGMVNSEATRQAYSFSSSEVDVLLLTMKSDSGTSGVVVALRDADTNETFGLSSTKLGGVRYRLLTATTNYLLEIIFPGGDEGQTYSVCLETESGSVTCSGSGDPVQPALPNATPVVPPPPVASPTIAPSGTCTVQPASAASINVRSGPGTGYSVVAQLPLGSSAPVLGRLADNSWFQVNVGGVIGWVSAAVVTLGGNCSGVSVVPAPALPTFAPSAQATATRMVPPTTTVTAAPTSTTTPASTATEPPTAGPLPTLPAFEAVETRPDLTSNTITSLAIDWGIHNGQNGQAPLVYVRPRNPGPGDAGPFTIRLCANNTCYDRTVSDLQAGSTIFLEIILEPELLGTTVSFALAIDFYNDVDEANEGNNLATFEQYLGT